MKSITAMSQDEILGEVARRNAADPYWTGYEGSITKRVGELLGYYSRQRDEQQDGYSNRPIEVRFVLMRDGSSYMSRGLPTLGHYEEKQLRLPSCLTTDEAAQFIREFLYEVDPPRWMTQ